MIGYTYLFPKFCFDKFECSPLIPSQVEVVVVVCGVDRNPWRAPVPLPGHCEKPTDLQVWEASGGMEASRRYEWDMFIGKHIAQRARNLSWKPSIILGFRDITATPPHIPSDKLIFFRGVGFHHQAAILRTGSNNILGQLIRIHTMWGPQTWCLLV